VQVIAQGQAGQFTIAYAVEAPHHTIEDVPFLPYKPVTVNPTDPNATTACDKLGNPGIVAAPQGAFDITFTASSVVKRSPDLKGPLDAPIECAIYHAADVTIAGPKAHAQPLQYFTVPEANLSSGPAPTFLTKNLPDGKYQILCL